MSTQEITSSISLTHTISLSLYILVIPLTLKTNTKPPIYTPKATIKQIHREQKQGQRIISFGRLICYFFLTHLIKETDNLTTGVLLDGFIVSQKTI